MWTAWHLLERDPDTRIVLLERERCGHGPSGRNGGFVNGYWGHAPAVAAALRLGRRDPPRRGGRRVDPRDRRVLQGSSKVDAWFRAVPQVEISTAAAQDGSWREEVEGLRRLGHGEELTELAPSQVQAICRSPAFRGGAVQRTAATVQPARLAFGLRAALLKRGVHDPRGHARRGRRAAERGRGRRHGRRPGPGARPRRGPRRELAHARLGAVRPRAERGVEPHRPHRARAGRPRRGRLDRGRGAVGLPPDAALLPHDEGRADRVRLGRRADDARRPPRLAHGHRHRGRHRGRRDAAAVLPGARGTRDHARVGRPDRRRAEPSPDLPLTRGPARGLGLHRATASAPRIWAAGSCRASPSVCATRSRRSRSSARP